MPPRYYRKHLVIRSKSFIHKKYLINQTFYSSNLQHIQQYFFDIIDSIILYSDMNIAIKQIQTLIKMISSKEDMYLLLDSIENTILSIIKNIGNGDSLIIINERISYVRELLLKLPEKCDNYDQFGNLIISIIESITNSVDFNIVNNNIIKIKALIDININNELYEKMDVIENILFSIIKNIGNGDSLIIINERISYLRELIVKLG